MDPYTQQTTQPIEPVSSSVDAMAPEDDKKKAHRLLVAITLLVLVAVGAIWYIQTQKNKVQTPEDVLMELERSSEPVTATAEERKASLDRLEEESAPVQKTNEQRLQDFEALQ